MSKLVPIGVAAGTHKKLIDGVRRAVQEAQC
jgi:hypothetical protein